MFQTYDPPSDKTFASKHLPLLRAQMSAQGLDAFLVPHEDEYLNEYLPDCAERLMWVSGFSGSAGAAIILTDSAHIFTDGRYTIQVRDQVDEALFGFEDIPDTSMAKWLEDHGSKDMVVGYDPMLHARNDLMTLTRAAQKAGFTLKAVSQNPIDSAWQGRPPAPMTLVTPHDAQYAGKTSDQKRQEIAQVLASKGADAALLTAPHSLAWLFNIRGKDVHATPLPLGRAIIHKDATADLFLTPEKTNDTLRAHLGNDIRLDTEENVGAALDRYGKTGKSILIDSAISPIWFASRLEAAGAKIIYGTDPCALPRACKNEGELNGTRSAHRRDGVAVTNFLHWLDTAAQSGDITEIDAAQKLEEFRKRSNQLNDISFDSISGAGSNGALCHYRVSTETNKSLDKGTLFLIDSGGQYPDGTTDITRTVQIGEASDEMRHRYTLVLKGHIALAMARFPKGTTGHQLDILARLPLFQAGLDYDHGTGHGVGSYLGVHEGPQNISKKAVNQPLMPGMICSNEPGFYKAGEYGIRIENLVIVTPYEPIEGGEREMMGFETITLAPLARDLIETTILTKDELAWVNDYHARVNEALSPDLQGEPLEWMKKATTPL